MGRRSSGIPVSVQMVIVGIVGAAIGYMFNWGMLEWLGALVVVAGVASLIIWEIRD